MHAAAYASFNNIVDTSNKCDSPDGGQFINMVETQVMKQLREEYGEAIYRSWFSHLRFGEITDSELVITTPTRFIREWISNNYLDHIKRILCSFLPAIKQIVIKVRDPLPLPSNLLTTDYISQSMEKCNIFDFTLDPNLILKNFTVNESNKVAHTVATAFAQNKQTNNLLYIQGNVGVGKTHLLQSITAHIKTTNPKRKVAYLSAEKFMQLYIRAVRDNNIILFKEKLRTADLLLIDDLQFICGKNSTEQELIGTISALTESNKQVIVSCNSSPYELNLDTRTKSRLAGGLVVNIAQPDYSLRLEILKSRVGRLNILVPNEILQFIASAITSNIRELEGAFNKLVSHCLITDKPMSLNITREVLQENITAHCKQICIDDILQYVANFYKIKVTDIQSKKRNAHFVLPRQVTAYIAKQLTTHSLQEIGLQLGNKDHTTVIYSIKKVEERINSDPGFANIISKIGSSLRA